ncbi:MAG: TetR/AcrR family transcriptional regulator [Methylotenera sp.]|uniref:TetR/AcrR family transcriptional regulator n=1 Tax=Methylotenera sp. TaxID=2051956 RepID=UPI0024877363|nr:TetR/AcrR family transcriptional regulator [Methylotenera sp.]MDI1309625.1 TetR/AcrR family transcriptional regulator [Methylotenera sp.]
MRKSKNTDQATTAGQRGPAEHERRDQIIQSADEHFRIYGYRKTSVSDLGKAIGVSNAYIYRFFESKQAIGEAICAMTLGRIVDAIQQVSNDKTSATNRIRNLYKVIVEQGLNLFFNEKKLHDIAICAVEEGWSTVRDYKQAKLDVIHKIIADGRDMGEFERKTPIDEVCVAILETLQPFAHPILLQQNEPEILKIRAVAVSNLVLRSLAP